MPQLRSERPVVQVSLIYSSLTCAYIVALIGILIFFEYIYKLGDVNSYVILLILAGIEAAKHDFVKRLHPPDRASRMRRRPLRIKMKENFFIVAVTFAYYGISVLLGASAVSNMYETFFFSILLTCLTVWPLYIHLGIDAAYELVSNLNLFKSDKFKSCILNTIRLTLFGSWAGAVVIPLDWDRPWQAWPIPCVMGALVGYALANFINVIILMKS